jgi:hypothetical protein
MDKSERVDESNQGVRLVIFHGSAFSDVTIGRGNVEGYLKYF